MQCKLKFSLAACTSTQESCNCGFGFRCRVRFLRRIRAGARGVHCEEAYSWQKKKAYQEYF
jgi:GH24 family phage-related lysozyme (muramidase)